MPPLAALAATQAAQILVAFGGGLVFHLFGVPAAWLSGAMIAVALWGAAGLARPLPRPLSDAALLVSGATLGSGITPDSLAAAARYPASLLVLGAAVVAITFASMLWLTRVSGWQRDDAILASVPGALSTVLAIAVDRRAGVAAIAVLQSIRLFVLVALLPSMVAWLGGGPAALLPGEGRVAATPGELATMLAGGWAAGLLFERLKLAAPALLGGMAVSAVLHGSGAVTGVVPPALAIVGLVMIGVYIGERFRTIQLSVLRRIATASMGSLFISTAIALLFAAMASLLTGIGLAEAVVAFAPGGLEAMMVLALVLGLDPLYVGVHHLARFFGIAIALPLIFRWLPTSSARAQQAGSETGG